MTTQTATHDHTTAYLVLAGVIIIVLAVGGVWLFAS
jgi:hypothetical protein